MLPEYALNKTNGKLHLANSHHEKICAVRSISVSLLPLFREYGAHITCCPTCLKNDERAKAAVEKWNYEIEHYH